MRVAGEIAPNLQFTSFGPTCGCYDDDKRSRGETCCVPPLLATRCSVLHSARSKLAWCAGRGVTCVVVLLVLRLVGLLLPEVSAVLADPVGDAPLLGGQGGAHHAVHGPPVAHVQAATQTALVLLQPHMPSGQHIQQLLCERCLRFCRLLVN